MEEVAAQGEVLLVRERAGRRLRARIRPGAEGRGGDGAGGGPCTGRVSLEVAVLAGYVMYGQLTVKRVPLTGGDASVEIDQSAFGSGDGFEPALASAGDLVEPGITEEFADAVLEGLRRQVAAEGLPPGCGLRVVAGAHAFAGSNALLFSRIAWSAAALLSARPQDLTDAYLLHLLDEMLKPLPRAD